MMAKAVLLMPMVALAMSCAHTAAETPAEVQKAVDLGNSRYGEAMKRGDAAAMAALFTDDASDVPPTASGILRGRAAIEAFNHGRVTGSQFSDITITTASLDVHGDLAVELGTYSLMVKTGDAEPAHRTGRYLVVWRHDGDGVWRILAHAPEPDPAK